VIVSPAATSGFVRACGQLRHIGRMSNGVTFTLFFASVEAGRTFVKIGMTSRAITATCRPIASPGSSRSFHPLTRCPSLLSASRRRAGAPASEARNIPNARPKAAKIRSQATASLLFTGPCGLGRSWKKSLRLSPTPVPNDI